MSTCIVHTRGVQINVWENLHDKCTDGDGYGFLRFGLRSTQLLHPNDEHICGFFGWQFTTFSSFSYCIKSLLKQKSSLEKISSIVILSYLLTSSPKCRIMLKWLSDQKFLGTKLKNESFNSLSVFYLEPKLFRS